MTSRRVVLLGLLILTVLALSPNLNSKQITPPSVQSSTAPYQFAPRTEAVKPKVTQVSPVAHVSHVVVKFKDNASVRLTAAGLVSKQRVPIASAVSALAPYAATQLRPLFNQQSIEQNDREREILEYKTGRQLADLNSYYRVEVTSPAEAEALVNELNADSSVEIAFVSPAPEPAGQVQPAATPNYQPFQDYREVAPSGVDADYANTLLGGDGTGIKIVDVEGAWQTAHEDLGKSVGGLIAGTMINDISWRNHGTAVLGEMIATNNGFGVTGICPGANIGMVSIGTMSAAEAIMIAVANLTPGDLILIELHAPGPHYNFESRTDQLGYVCMEYWQDNFDAIQYAWAKGITVIEAAGNGAENFNDTTIYAHLFDTTYRNSHAILAGAGYQAASASDRQRLSFSNYGRRVNLQGYGRGVYSCGYGDLYGTGETNYYTASFSGTSSASPIVTGSVACLQGYFKHNYGTVMTSDVIRDRLVATGSPQLGDTTQHIGPRPDLRAAITGLNPPPSLYATPIMLDTTLAQGTSVSVSVWLHNRSVSNPLAYSVVGKDSLTSILAPDWLRASPASGTVPAADSTQISVTIDASLLAQSVSQYKGVVEIHWGPVPQPLDSLTLVPVFLSVPCNDTTYKAIASTDAGGPTYHWISAKTLGTKITNSAYYNSGGLNPLDDGTAGPLPIGFTIPYYDSAYSQMFIGVNGALSFKDTNLNSGGYFAGLALPGAPFQTFVAPLWADLVIDTTKVPQSGIYIYRNPAHDTTVIEWYRMSNFVNFDTLTDFELILTGNGRMLFQYQNVTSGTLNQTALVGISEIGCRALQYVDNGVPASHIVADGRSVLVTPGVVRQWVMSGNVDGIGSVDIGDLTFLVTYIFASGAAPVPFQSGDLDCNGAIDISDLTILVDYLFASGTPPCYFWQVITM